MDLLAIIAALGGAAGIGGLVTSLFLLRANREKLRAEVRCAEAEAAKVLASAEHIIAQSGLSEAETVEKLNAVAMVWIQRFEKQLKKANERISALESERQVLIERVAAHEQDLAAIRAERNALQNRVTVLEERLSVVIEERDQLQGRLCEIRSRSGA